MSLLIAITMALAANISAADSFHVCQTKALTAAKSVCAIETEHQISEIQLNGADSIEVTQDGFIFHLKTNEGYPLFCSYEIVFSKSFCEISTIRLIGIN